MNKQLYPPTDLEGKIMAYLQDGANLSKTARMANLSPAAILKRARKYVLAGLLVRVSKGVYQKPNSLPTLPPISRLPSLPQPIMLPVKFGAIFALPEKKRIPTLKYDNYGKAYIETPLYKCQIGNRKAQLWLKGGFQGNTVEERIYNGKKMLIDIAANISNNHKVELTLVRFYEGIEWVETSINRSKITADGVKIKKGGKIEVAGAIHKFSDSSHPDYFQINPKVGGEPSKSSEHAKYRENLYSGEYERRFEMVMAALEKLTEVAQEIRAWKELEKRNK